MNLRTYEILAKWIGRACRINIEFYPDIVPCANLKTNTIKLPSNIKNENVYGALSTLMHEAAHLRYTPQIPHDLVKEKLGHSILNVMEDVRIDNYNFSLLPNIHAFYERAIKDDKARRKTINMDKVPLFKKVMVNCIYELEYLKNGIIKDKDASDFEAKHNVSGIVDEGRYAIERGDWKTVKKKIQEIKKLFGLDKQPPIPLDPQVGPGDSLLFPNGGVESSGDGSKEAEGPEDGDISVLMSTGSKASSFGCGKGDGTSISVLGSVAVQEQTKRTFKELLNIKEIHRINKGLKLNTNSLLSFFTEDIDSLFIEDEIEQRKKSKIMILIDSSGSMTSPLLDDEARKSVVGGTVRELVLVLKEVQEQEGIDVDYDIACFDDKYHPLSKENWEREYCSYGGGTNLLNAFKLAQDNLLKNQEIDGNRLMILFTDGEVSDDEIESMRKLIVAHGGDVRCMVIGVGADINSAFVQNVIGDFNVLAKDAADIILLEAIMTMLS